jgi:hypothetical protein
MPVFKTPLTLPIFTTHSEKPNFQQLKVSVRKIKGWF